MAKEGIRAFIDMDDILSFPRNLYSTFLPRNIMAKNYPLWRKGDNDAVFALWADNLATQLSLLGLITGLPGMPADFVYKNMTPGIGVSLLFGNAYYALQASRVATETGNYALTAQPYGINTPGAFAKTFGIIFAVYFNADPEKGYGFDGSNGPATADKAWKIACACNFVSGLIEVFGAFVAPFVSRVVPSTVLLAPIAGIGLAWLHFNHFVDVFHYPLEMFVPFLIMWVAYFGGVKSKHFPVAMLSIVFGCVMCWITGYNTKEKLDAAGAIVKVYSGAFGVCFEEMGAVGDFINILIPIALTSSFGTLMCVRSAEKQGDVFSPTETMIIDGLGTMLGALFGSPFGTTVYIGHPAYKQMGASRGYSLLNGIVYFIMGFTGLHALFDSLIGKISVYPVICFIGLFIGDQICRATPKRWYPAMLLGVLMTLSDWAVTSFSDGGAMPALGALGFMKEGYLFTTMVWTWAFCMLTDRKFLQSALIFAGAAAMALVGLMHSAVVSLDYNKHLAIVGGIPASAAGLEGLDEQDGLPGWKFVVGYLLMAAASALMLVLQKASLIDPPDEGETEVELEGAAGAENTPSLKPAAEAKDGATSNI